MHALQTRANQIFMGGDALICFLLFFTLLVGSPSGQEEKIKILKKKS